MATAQSSSGPVTSSAHARWPDIPQQHHHPNHQPPRTMPDDPLPPLPSLPSMQSPPLIQPAMQDGPPLPPPDGLPDDLTDTHVKAKGRQRLLRGISRMASSPSLVQFTGRSRSASTPYTRSGATMSCVSLASGPSPFGPPSSSTMATGSGSGSGFGSASGSGFVFSPLGSPALLESPPSSSTSLCLPPATPRRVDLLADPSGNRSRSRSNSTVPLPPDVTRMAAVPVFTRPRKTFAQLWSDLPHELQVFVLGFLQPKELVRLSRVSRAFHDLCFDGQLWTCFDASDFYQDISVESLSNIIARAGPFVKDLNLRGCIQVEGFDQGRALARACTNLVHATLEGSLIDVHNLETLLHQNARLESVNLTGLGCVNLSTCTVLSQSCSQLQVLNLSWCKNVTANMLVPVVRGCPALRDLRVGEVRGFDSQRLARALFATNRLERLVLSGSPDLNDAALCTMLHGQDPEIDPLTDRPMVPPRRLRHLDLSRCRRLTNRGIAALGYCVPDLEGLVLAGCGAPSGGADGPSPAALTDAALEPILASTPRLAYLDLEDLAQLTNDLLSNHLARAPSAAAGSLVHLSISYCENLGDAGMLPVLRACPSLRSIDMDNTRISDLVLAGAAAMVRERFAATAMPVVPAPHPGLSLTVYDCPNVTWTGVREVLSRNAEVLRAPSSSSPEIISLKCYYGWQMTVDEHTKRVLRGNRAGAARLERKWADYMQANEEAGAGGAGNRRRRRRAREAQQVHDEEEAAGVGLDAVPGVGGTGIGIGRRRARTTACVIM